MVSRTGAFEELPDDSCIKVDVDDAEEELLLEYLRVLARRPALGAALGRNARRYVERAARLEDAAYDYYRFIYQVLERPLEIEPVKDHPVTAPGSTVPTPPEPALSAASPPVETCEAADKLPGGWTALAQAAAEIGLDETDPVLEEVTRAARFAGL
jgi:hypothetical protein